MTSYKPRIPRGIDAVLRGSIGTFDDQAQCKAGEMFSLEGMRKKQYQWVRCRYLLNHHYDVLPVHPECNSPHTIVQFPTRVAVSMTYDVSLILFLLRRTPGPLTRRAVPGLNFSYTGVEPQAPKIDTLWSNVHINFCQISQKVALAAPAAGYFSLKYTAWKSHVISFSVFRISGKCPLAHAGHIPASTYCPKICTRESSRSFLSEVLRLAN